MPYTTDPKTGAQVPTGTAVPATSRDGIRTTLTNHESRLGALEDGIDDIPVGGATPSTGAFTSLSASGALAVTGAATFGSTITLSGIEISKSELDALVIASDVTLTSTFTFTAYAVTCTNLNVGSGTIGIGSTRTIKVGAGTPEGSVTADPGSLYLNTSGGYGTTLYVKVSGSASNTGWSRFTSPDRPNELPLVDFGGLASYPAASYARCLLYYSPGSGNKKIIFSDGAAWRYMDGTAV